MSDEARTPDAERIVVIRPARMPRGILVPLAMLVLAGAGFAIRMGVSDWRGLSQETSRRWNGLFASRPEQAKPAPVAQVKPPSEKAKPGDTPAPAPAVADAPKDQPKAAPKEDLVAAAPKDNAAWDDIRKAAEKAREEQQEAERIKEEADRKIAETPPPPPRLNPRMRALDPAALAVIRERQREMMRQMEEMMGRQENDFGKMVRQQMEAQRRFMEDFARNRPGLGQAPGAEEWPPRFRIPPGFEGFDRPLPGMDRMNAPLPGQPRVRERSGEEIRNGVKTRWKSRVIVLGPEGFGGGR